MKIGFILILIGLFIGITTLNIWITKNTNESVGLALGFMQTLICVSLLLFGPVIFSYIEEKGLYYDYGSTLKTSPLMPLDPNCDSIYLETRIGDYGERTYHFRTNDSTDFTKEGWQCEVIYHKESIEPYYEIISVEAKPWFEMIFEPNHNRLQPRYFLHIQSKKNEKEIPPKDNICPSPY
jgi:hypothetical protein